MRLFSNRSQKTSKCGKNIRDKLSYTSCATFLFLPHFDVICELLLKRRTATWNLFVKLSYRNACENLGELEKLWKHSPVACVPTAFLALPNFHLCFYRNMVHVSYFLNINLFILLPHKSELGTIAKGKIQG